MDDPGRDGNRRSRAGPEPLGSGRELELAFEDVEHVHVPLVVVRPRADEVGPDRRLGHAELRPVELHEDVASEPLALAGPENDGTHGRKLAADAG